MVKAVHKVLREASKHDASQIIILLMRNDIHTYELLVALIKNWTSAVIIFSYPNFLRLWAYNMHVF